MNTITTIGLDIAKNSFTVHAEDAEGCVVVKKDLKRKDVTSFFAKLSSTRCLVGIEACGSAHHWAREITKLGHDARLIPAQRVKAFLPRQKNDAADAKAICAAVRRPDMRFVPVKSVEDQSSLMMHQVRELG